MSTQAGSRRVVVLGSTGSIGKNCLDVIAHLGDRFEVWGLCANSSWEVLLEQAERWQPRWLCVTDPRAGRKLAECRLPDRTRLLVGMDNLDKMVADPEVDIVVSAIVGAAGLTGTWLAVDAGKTVALANKETLVMAGPLVMELARAKNATILPVDSEHSAIFQALQTSGEWRVASGEINPESSLATRHSPLATRFVERIVLTASGGPFRGRKAEELADVTVEEALNHPTWRMGPKISIDSATMMNKALEIIEARWLFDLEPDQIDVIVHPESIIHSFVEFRDGSILAQLSPPDMRLPIQYALTYPQRLSGPTRRLRWSELRSLNFSQPDLETFSALQLGHEVARRGGTCGAVLNAANEAAVSRFLAGELSFLDVPRACGDVLAHHNFSPRPTLSELNALDRWARQEVDRWNSKKACSMTR